MLSLPNDLLKLVFRQLRSGDSLPSASCRRLNNIARSCPGDAGKLWKTSYLIKNFNDLR